METTEPTFSAADLAYLETAYTTLENACAAHGLDVAEVEARIRARQLPQPPYTLPDGRRLVPPDYFALLDAAGFADELPALFARRFAAAAADAGLEPTAEWNARSEWDDYLDGTYWACLWEATPETMIEKERLIR